MLGRERKLRGLPASADMVVLELLTCVEKPVQLLSSWCCQPQQLPETLCVQSPHLNSHLYLTLLLPEAFPSLLVKNSLFSRGQMLPLIRSLPLPHLFDATEAFVAEPRLKSSLRKPGEVTGTQQPHVLCGGYFHHPNYTFCINQRLRLLIKTAWQLGLLITPVPNHRMKGTEGTWPAWWKSWLCRAHPARVHV